MGVKATVDGVVVEVGGPYLLQQHQLEELPVADEWRNHGATILHVLADQIVIGALQLADQIRPESRDSVDALHAVGVQVVMISGDAQAVADSVAAELGIDRVFAGVRPRTRPPRSPNCNPRAARWPWSVLSVIDFSRASYRKMKQHLWWAAAYNLIAVPLAAGVLAPIGFVLPMSIGALLMSASTVVVALNAQLLQRLDPTPTASTAKLLHRDTAEPSSASSHD